MLLCVFSNNPTKIFFIASRASIFWKLVIWSICSSVIWGTKIRFQIDARVRYLIGWCCISDAPLAFIWFDNKHQVENPSKTRIASKISCDGKSFCRNSKILKGLNFWKNNSEFLFENSKFKNPKIFQSETLRSYENWILVSLAVFSGCQKKTYKVFYELLWWPITAYKFKLRSYSL